MPPATVDHCLSGFVGRIVTNVQLLAEARNYHIRQPDGSYRWVGARRIERIAGFALLDMHLGWEQFVEDVFVRYMCGATTSSAFSPTLAAPPERNVGLAMRKLLASQPYLRWTSNDIISRATAFFANGDPFAQAVRSARQQLEDISIIRNAVAHRSEHAKSQFRQVVRRELGYNPRGMTVGRFLLTRRAMTASHGQPYIEYYADVLRTLGQAIVP
jgi:hypothetical protein